MTNTLKNILVGGAFILLLIAGFFMISQTDSVTLSLDGVSLVSGDLLAKTQVFIGRGATLQALEIKTELLTDMRFTSLRSYTTEIPEQSVGRTNIFEAPTAVPTTRTVPVE